MYFGGVDSTQHGEGCYPSGHQGQGCHHWGWLWGKPSPAHQRWLPATQALGVQPMGCMPQSPWEEKQRGRKCRRMNWSYVFKSAQSTTCWSRRVRLAFRKDFSSLNVSVQAKDVFEVGKHLLTLDSLWRAGKQIDGHSVRTSCLTYPVLMGYAFLCTFTFIYTGLRCEHLNVPSGPCEPS